MRQKIDALLSDHRLACREHKNRQAELIAAEDRLHYTEEAVKVVQHVGQTMQQEAHKRIAAIVTRCLSTVFDEFDTFHVKRSEIPQPVIYGTTKVPGRDRWIILEIHNKTRMDSEEGELSRIGKSMLQRKAQVIQRSESSTPSVCRPAEGRTRGVPLPGSECDEQQAGKPLLGESQGEHETSEGARKRGSVENKSRDRGSDKKKVRRGGSHDADTRRRIRTDYRHNTSNNSLEDMVLVRAKKICYEFVIEFERKRNRTEAVLLFKREGVMMDPMSASGGGVVDVASFALRLASLILSKPQKRRLLVLDEPFRFLSADYHGRVRALLERMAEEMDVQIIMVTHIEALKCGKVVEVS